MLDFGVKHGPVLGTLQDAACEHLRQEGWLPKPTLASCRSSSVVVSDLTLLLAAGGAGAGAPALGVTLLLVCACGPPQLHQNGLLAGTCPCSCMTKVCYVIKVGVRWMYTALLPKQQINRETG